MSMQPIEAPSRIEASNVESLVTRMASRQQEAPTAPISLDMEGVDAISRPAGAFLSNALLTQLAGVSLVVVAPARSPVKKLTCSGLGFAFAHRRGQTSFQNLDRDQLRLDRWRLPWTPARSQPDTLPVTEPAGRDDPLLVSDDPLFVTKADAAFVNPHATARRLNRRDVPTRVQGWLRSVLPPRALGAPAGTRFLEDLQDLVYELVDNVAEHAWPRDAVEEPRSLVQVSVARGNEAETRDRVWVVVMDTGPGIVATATPKVAAPELRDDELLRGILSGTVMGQRARGLGLPRVVRIARRWKDARLHIVTGGCRVSVHRDKIEVSVAEWQVHGTVIIARFTTPPVSLNEPA